jgi:hypothetical protein
MKPKTTIILFLIAVGILLFIRFYESGLRTTKEIEAGRYILQMDRDTIDYIRIKNDEGTVELERKGAKWRMTTPVKDAADASAIARFFTNIEGLKARAEIKGKGPEEFGLEHSKVRLKIKGSEGVRELIVGSDLPVEGTGYYVQIEDEPAIYAVTGDLKQQMSEKPDAFRDKRLSEVNVAEVEKFELKTDAGTIVAARESGNWELIQPLKARGDGQRIQDLLAELLTAQVEGFAANDKTNLGNFGLTEPQGTITLHVEDREEPVVLNIGEPIGASLAGEENAKGGGSQEKRYATASTRNAIFEISPDLGKILNTKPNDIRDRNVVRLNPDIVDRMTITSEKGNPIVLVREGEHWKIKGDPEIPANDTAANTLLDNIGKAKAEQFVADVASELPKYGLDQPKLSLKFSSFASENTAESKAGESEIVTIHFGDSKGGNTFVQVEGEPFVVSVKDSLVTDITKSIGEWKSLEVFDLKPEDIDSLEIQRAGHQPVTLKLNKDSEWKSPEGAVDVVAVKSLVNTLAGLRAIRWISEGEAGEFKEPGITVAFDGRRLLIDSKNEENQWRSRVDGEEGTFLMSQPDYEAFAATLVTAEAEAPVPLPAAAATP